MQVLQEYHVVTLRDFTATASAVDGRLAVLGDAYLDEYAIAAGLRPAMIDVDLSG